MRMVVRSVFAALVLSASCHFTSDAALTGITGSYTLVRVDGSPLPFALASGFTVRGTLNMTNDAKFTLTQTDSAAGGLTNFSLSGQWTVTENAIQFISSAPLQLGIASIDSVRTTYRSHENLYVKR
jgi:hypothetical protein